jgi:hypothetical protein
MAITLLCEICDAPVTSEVFEETDVVSCQKCWVD